MQLPEIQFYAVCVNCPPRVYELALHLLNATVTLNFLEPDMPNLAFTALSSIAYRPLGLLLFDDSVQDTYRGRPTMVPLQYHCAPPF